MFPLNINMAAGATGEFNRLVNSDTIQGQTNAFSGYNGENVGVAEMRPNIFNKYECTVFRVNRTTGDVLFTLRGGNLPDNDETWKELKVTGDFEGGTNPRSLTFTRSAADTYVADASFSNWIFEGRPLDDLFVDGNDYDINVSFDSTEPRETDTSTVRATNDAALFVDDSFSFTVIGDPIGPVDFQSSAVCWPETGQTIGKVPAVYAGYKMLRTQGMHFNLKETCSFDLDSTHTVIYGHPVIGPDTIRPAFLSTWTDTGERGEMIVPDRDGFGRVTTVYYYSASISSLSWDWKTADIADRLKYFVGFFLFPDAAVLSNIYPETYELLPAKIDETYVKPVRDAMYWDIAPATRPAATETASSWSNFASRINGASPGDVIAAPAGTFSNDGQLVISGVKGTAENPIWIVGNQTSGVPTTTLRGVTGLRFVNCEYIRVWGFGYDRGTNNSGHTIFIPETDCKWMTFQNNWFRNWGATDNRAQIEGHMIYGSYCRVSNCTANNKTSAGGLARINSVSGNDTLAQFCRIDHCVAKDWNVGSVIPAGVQNHYMIAAGRNANFQGRTHALIDHNLLQNYNLAPDDAEAGLFKSIGNIAWANEFRNNKGRGMNLRTGSFAVHIRNREYLNKTSSTGDSMTTIQGVELQPGNVPEGDNIVCGNYMQNVGHANGWLELMAVSQNSSNRWYGPRALIVSNIGYDCRRRWLKLNKFSDPVNYPTEIYIQGNAAECDEEVIQDQYDPNLADITWSGNVLNGSSLGITNPGGIVEESPNFTNRGDGIFIPNNANIDPGDNIHIPGEIESSIDDLGTTYPSA